MRFYYFGLLLLALFSCKKNKELQTVCRFTSVNRAGGNLPVNYSGDTLVIWGEGNYGTRMYFKPAGTLLRLEEPVADPFIRTDLLYNSNGKIAGRKVYFKEGSDWVYKATMIFSYVNNRIMNIREESNFGTPANYDFDLTWNGDNVASVTSRRGSNILCTKQFSYDITKNNPMINYSYLYFSDGDANYAGYKLPFYFSKNLVVKEESNCTLSETRNFSYTFKSNGLIESVLDNGQLLWGYTYDCP
ncbi:MAG: hypothetical protein V4717_09325 [Bacteroidota bacterium]